MTPKEKAEELYSTYRYVLSLPNAPLGENKDVLAKQCALIAVDETLRALHFNVWTNVDEINYWKEVKQEIEQL
jgi:hypothetical protein